jgi:hypothetical protein
MEEVTGLVGSDLVGSEGGMCLFVAGFGVF